MKLIAQAIVLFSLGAAKLWSSALAVPVDGQGVTAPRDPPGVIQGYGISIPEWEVEVFPGGRTIQLNGTIQEVRSELLRINPDWDSQYLANTTNVKESSNLSKRAFDLSGYFCHGRWNFANAIEIDKGIDYLRGVKGQPHRGPGPGNCERVSCSWSSAIYWCNDDHTDKTLQGGYGDIADGALIIARGCNLGMHPWTVVSGQAFATSNWNVIVRGEGC